MTESTVSTLLPKDRVQDVLESMPTSRSADTSASERMALFDSIAHDPSGNPDANEPTAAKAVLTGLLWFGYATAILVALVLVWSTAKGLLR